MTDPAAPSPLPPPLARRARAVVLVHGAWVGEWCWAPLLPWLERSGRPVHAVSLTGHGARRHQSAPTVTLDDHVADLVGVFDAHDLVDATVVAHSYGGRVATKACQELADRVARIVYLDAHAPLLDGAAAPSTHLPAVVDGMVPVGPFPPDPAVFGPDGVTWFLERAVPQSASTLSAPFHVDLPDAIERCYVFATGVPESPFTRYAEAAAARPDWEYHELPGDHWLMASHPREIAAIALGDGRVPSDEAPT